MRTPKDADLARNRRSIQRTLSRHFETPTVTWAIRQVELELFRYQPTNGTTCQLWTHSQVNRLRDAGAKPLEILQRILECYALRHDDDYGSTFPNRRTWLAFLARKVLLLKRGVLPEHSSAYRLAHLGALIEETFSKFATATLIRMDRDQGERAAFDVACAEFVNA
jgi:hypothetical protein